MLHRSKADRVAMRLSLQFALEFFDLLKNPRIIGGMLSYVLLQPRLAAAQDPVDESAKQPHAYIQAHFNICEARPPGPKANRKPSLDNRKALRPLPFCPRENERQLNNVAR
ncbi:MULTISPECIES: hypothetical protein [Rhizobium]|jgi:hypothetical protein|uniref:hypothetical protein n=1 Tax=Rhizobium TaxID=379 RepID=UPI0011995F6F|nr:MULTISPECIES: hypothetical protein [Rhizobium]MBB3285676.1 hypothetical protein [Rhizobium sp. BK252]MBB3400416.1 hypothetical protein [Rhizobium sp. BK289]MBB3412995.1 hypothetical protein [Rhizobium sp. BK284]MBB3480882.1 hypothetical protein [Rhizobium sp. BK347]MDK4721557.1 hypothetical protein [Rhizobium sp. CNPSo 3968]